MARWFSRLRRSARGSAPGPDYEDTFTEDWDALTARAQADAEANRTATLGMTAVVTEISATLLKHDPIGLRAMGSPDDEYDAEAETIVLSLSDRSEPPTPADVLEIIHEEFVRWFGDMAGDRERYTPVTGEVHRIWGDYLAEE